MSTPISVAALREEAAEALERVWYVQSLEEIERADNTVAFRLLIRPGLFINVFVGARTESLYFALIEGKQRIFGIDCEGSVWHQHPFEASDIHEPLPVGLMPKPLLTFLARVEPLLMEHNLL